MNLAKAQEALKSFEFYKAGRLQEIIYPIQKLSNTFCGQYVSPSIMNNKFLAEFYSSDNMSTEDQLGYFTSYLQELPTELQAQVNSESIPTNSGYLPGVSAGGGFLADRLPPEETKIEMFPDSSRDFHILKYNTAVLAHKTQNYQLALFYLKDIFKEVAFMDEYMLLKTSFFLMEVLLNLKRPAHAQVIHRFILDHKAQILKSTDDRLTMDVSLEQKGEEESKQEESKADERNMIHLETISKSIQKEGRHTYMLTLGGYVSMHGICPIFTPKSELQFMLDLMSVRIQASLANNTGKKGIDLPQGLRAEECIEKIEMNFIDETTKKPNVTFAEPDLIPVLKSHLRAARAFTLAEHDLKLRNNPIESMNRMRVQATTKGGQYGWPPTASRPDHQLPQSHFLFPAYYFNNMGVVHLRLKRVKLAILYFQRALDCVSCEDEGNERKHLTSTPLTHFTDESSEKICQISYNLAFSHQLNGEYKQAFDIYKELLPYMGERGKIWYRLGECCFYYYFQHLLAESEHLDPLIASHAGYNPEIPQHYSKKGNFIPPQNFSRFYLRLSQIIPSQVPSEMDLSRAKHYLQAALIMLRNQTEQHSQQLAFLKEVRHRYNPEKLEEQRLKPIRIYQKDQKPLNPQNQRMFIRIHLLLAHIALTKQDHVQCLNTLAMIEGNSQLTKKELFYIQCYKAEAFCRQGNSTMAMKLLRDKQIASEKERYLLQNSMNHYTYHEWMSSYSISAVNYISAAITEGNLGEAVHTMDNIINQTSTSLTEYMPLPLLVAKVYLLLREGDNLTAARFLKNKRNLFTVNLGCSVKEVN